MQQVLQNPLTTLQMHTSYSTVLRDHRVGRLSNSPALLVKSTTRPIPSVCGLFPFTGLVLSGRIAP